MFKQLVCKGSLFQYFVVACGEFGSPYLGKASVAARAVQPIPITVRSLFHANNYMAASVWDF